MSKLLNTIKNGLSLRLTTSHAVNGINKQLAYYNERENFMNPRYTNISKENDDQLSKLSQTTRPALPLPYLSTDSGAKYPVYPIPPVRLYEIADFIPDVRTVIDVIQREMFKNGFKVQPRFNYKCNNCDKEFKQKPLKQIDPFSEESKNNTEPLMECDVCFKTGDANFRTPDPFERKVLQNLFDHPVNANGQTLEELSRQYERDLDVVDNGYCCVLKKYYLKKIPRDPVDGATMVIDEKKTEIGELVRVHPAQVAFIADSDGRIGYDDNRNKVYICPNFNHRSNRLVEPVCPKCGTRAIKAVAEVNSVFSVGIVQPKRVYYGEDEIIWTAGKFEPDLLYGYSPLISIWRKAVALNHMDEYVLKYFDKQRPPRSLLVVSSRNFDSFNQNWEKLKEGARDDPSLPRPMLVENEKGGAKNAVEHIDLVGNLKDLEFTEVRSEFRQMIFAAYGFPPFLYGQVDKGGFGGANMQITQSNRTIKSYQMLLKKDLFDKICKAVNVIDWEIILNEGEETDELRDEQLLGQRLDNAAKKHNDLGLDVWLDGNGIPQSSQMPNPKFIESQMGDRMGDRGDKSPSTKPKEEEDTKFQGEIHNKNPSDEGGSAQGDPNSGSSLNNKAMDEDNQIHNIILKGINEGWTQNHMAKQIIKILPVPIKEATELVKESLKQGLYSYK